MGVAVDLRKEFGHDSQLGIIRANLDIEVLHVVRRALPPIFGVVRSIICVVDRRWLSILRTSRPVKVETVQPNPSAIEHLSGVVLTERLRGIWEVKIQVCGSPGKRGRKKT